jgi:hypothetical protein
VVCSHERIVSNATTSNATTVMVPTGSTLFLLEDAHNSSLFREGRGLELFREGRASLRVVRDEAESNLEDTKIYSRKVALTVVYVEPPLPAVPHNHVFPHSTIPNLP